MSETTGTKCPSRNARAIGILHDDRGKKEVGVRQAERTIFKLHKKVDRSYNCVERNHMLHQTGKSAGSKSIQFLFGCKQKLPKKLIARQTLI